MLMGLRTRTSSNRCCVVKSDCGLVGYFLTESVEFIKSGGEMWVAPADGDTEIVIVVVGGTEESTWLEGDTVISCGVHKVSAGEGVMRDEG